MGALPKSKSRLIIVQFEVEGDLMPLAAGHGHEGRPPGGHGEGIAGDGQGPGDHGHQHPRLEKLSEDNPPPTLDYTPGDLYIPSAPAQFTRMLDSIEDRWNTSELDIASIGQSVTNTLRGVTQLCGQTGKAGPARRHHQCQRAAGQSEGRLATKLQDTVGQVQETIKGMKLDTVSQNADGLVTGLRETNPKLQTVLDNAGAMPLQQTVADLRRVLENLNDVLTELKRYPSGFLFGKPPPPVPESNHPDNEPEP